MEKRTDLKIPYGIADFKRIRTEGWCYVDKTECLAKLEERDSFVFFVRPRRFGKSLFVDMLRLYYDRNEKANFEKLFGGLWIGAHPTENRNRYLVLALDFSKAGPTDGMTLVESFTAYLGKRLDLFAEAYPEVFDLEFRKSIANDSAAAKYTALVGRAKAAGSIRNPAPATPTSRRRPKKASRSSAAMRPTRSCPNSQRTRASTSSSYCTTCYGIVCL